MNYKDLEFSTYPGFDEYILVKNLVDTPVKYKRGASYETIYNNEFNKWQDFFCQQYQVPAGKDVLLLHCCSWAKPYDFSIIINPIKQIADKYKNVHRVIMSNVGVVPYEFQMNETFCGYDFMNVDNEEKNVQEINHLYAKSLEERLFQYLESHIDRYKQVVLYSRPINMGNAPAVKNACERAGIPLIIEPNIDIYVKYRQKKYKQLDELFIEKECLDSLDKTLQLVGEKVGS
ncbi:DUF5591 domain-containing protein [Priestia aryabhattai]|uniref:DUF5591 domain-containing protein n=1 Tax=Priestia aryabhattai TaxID=412384 RepID=UPI002E230026|nr:DUF5591 domain-containing protein [Priestia aryabhattai]